VKLPKSFLAVNLSESHTFHKKEELDDNSETIAETQAMKDDHQRIESFDASSSNVKESSAFRDKPPLDEDSRATISQEKSKIEQEGVDVEQKTPEVGHEVTT